jgi:hypothetical protein
VQTGVLTLVAAAVPPTVMIATVLLEQLERHLLGPQPEHAEPGRRPAAPVPASRATGPPDRAAPPIDRRGGDVPTGPIRQSQPRRRMSANSPPDPSTIRAALVTNPAGWEKPG